VVLVAEDEPTVRTLAESNIAELDYATLSAATGREALALLNEGAPVTVLFTDINMPDESEGNLDGIELARRAGELRPGLRVIYTSGSPPTDDMIALFVEGSTFLRKPYTREELLRVVRADPEAADSKFCQRGLDRAKNASYVDLAGCPLGVWLVPPRCPCDRIHVAQRRMWL